MKGSNEEDINTISLILKGDVELYETIVRKYQQRVKRFCFSMLYDDALSDDAAQEVFLKAYRALSGYTPEAKFLTWLLRIARNQCIDMIRKRKRTATQNLEEISPAHMSADHVAVNRPMQEIGLENRQTIEAILLGLSDSYREVIILRDVQGLSYEEIAKVLECSLDSVKAKLRRARAQIQEHMRHFMDTESVIREGE